MVYFLCTILRVEPDGCCVDGCSVLDTMSTSSFAQKELRNGVKGCPPLSLIFWWSFSEYRRIWIFWICVCGRKLSILKVSWPCFDTPR